MWAKLQKWQSVRPTSSGPLCHLQMAIHMWHSAPWWSDGGSNRGLLTPRQHSTCSLWVELPITTQSGKNRWVPFTSASHRGATITHAQAQWRSSRAQFWHDLGIHKEGANLKSNSTSWTNFICNYYKSKMICCLSPTSAWHLYEQFTNYCHIKVLKLGVLIDTWPLVCSMCLKYH